MLRFFNIISTSLRMALQEFRSNKLRTFLSLLGVCFGIFCIISVLSTISSMEAAIQNDIKTLGTNTIYIDKWEYRNDNNYPWWKFIKRPEMKFSEMKRLQETVPLMANSAFMMKDNANMGYENDELTGINYYGVTEEFSNIQPIEIAQGRYLQQSDFDQGNNGIVVGYLLAEKLFSDPARAVGKIVRLKNNRPAIIIGVIKKQGQSMLNIWDFDNSVVMAHTFLRQMVREEQSSPVIIVQGKANVPIDALKDELTGAMRSIRRLSPTQEDNYALNDIAAFSNFFHELFGKVTIGGAVIAILSLLVGMFGVANIMFVTVRERTSQIGLKKALGAKRLTILSEFLLESAFLCIIGGLIGMIAVFVLAQIFSAILPFHVFIPPGTILLAIIICLLVGVIAGIIPAFIAAKMDPVVAIRSK